MNTTTAASDTARLTSILKKARRVIAMGWRERWASPAIFRMADVPLLLAEAYRRGLVRGYPDPNGFTLASGEHVAPLVPAIMVAYQAGAEWAKSMAAHADCFVQGRLHKMNQIHHDATWWRNDNESARRRIATNAGNDTAALAEFYRQVELSRVICRGILHGAR